MSKNLIRGRLLASMFCFSFALTAAANVRTLALVIFCGAFWAGISYLAMRLLG